MSCFQELRIGDNDTLSAQVATVVAADWLFLLTDVPNLFTANPNTNPDAQPIYDVADLSRLHVRNSSEEGGLAGWWKHTGALLGRAAHLRGRCPRHAACEEALLRSAAAALGLAVLRCCMPGHGVNGMAWLAMWRHPCCCVVVLLLGSRSDITKGLRWVHNHMRSMWHVGCRPC